MLNVYAKVLYFGEPGHSQVRSWVVYFVSSTIRRMEQMNGHELTAALGPHHEHTTAKTSHEVKSTVCPITMRTTEQLSFLDS